MKRKQSTGFSAGVKAVDSDDLIVAGSTAPVGNNDVYRTSPQRWATMLKVMGAGACFDIYSHHPYTPGGSVTATPWVSTGMRVTSMPWPSRNSAIASPTLSTPALS